MSTAGAGAWTIEPANPWTAWSTYEPGYRVQHPREVEQRRSRAVPVETPPRRPVVCGIELPFSLAALGATVEKSKRILQLPIDPDDENSPPYQQQDWERAARFVLSNSLQFWEQLGLAPVVPAIHHGPDGSIDVIWEHQERRLLLNVPAEGDALATYFGHDPRGFEVKGSLDINATNHWFIALIGWMLG